MLNNDAVLSRHPAITKPVIGRRIAAAAAATVYNCSRAVFRGPPATKATASKCRQALGRLPSGGASCLTVVFESAGLGVVPELTLNASARCPPSVLPVFCTGAGFEVLQVASNNERRWVRTTAVLVGQTPPSVILQLPQGVVAARVRYGYADWPVTSLRAGDFPIESFDLAVSPPNVARINTEAPEATKAAEAIEATKAAEAIEATEATVPACDPKTSANPVGCHAMNALHARYYEPLEGGWKDTQFWGSGEALQATIDYTAQTGDLSFVPIIKDVIKRRGKTVIELLGTGSYDDMQWWSLAYINAGRLLNETSYVAEGKAIFDHVLSQALDNTTCGGGVFWSHDSKGFHYKNAITNELAIQNAILLYKSTQEPHYLTLATKLWQWFNASGIIDVEVGLVGDGLNVVDPNNKSHCRGTGGACCVQLRACCPGQ